MNKGAISRTFNTSHFHLNTTKGFSQVDLEAKRKRKDAEPEVLRGWNRLICFTKPSNVRVSRNFKWFSLSAAQQAHSFHKPGFHMIAAIAVIAAIADKNGSAIAAIDGFHMIAAIAE